MKFTKKNIVVLLIAAVVLMPIGAVNAQMMRSGSQGGSGMMGGQTGTQSGSNMMGGQTGAQGGSSMMGGQGVSGMMFQSKFSGFGTVVSVDTTANTITLDVQMGSRLIKSDVGKTVTYTVSSTVFIGQMGSMGPSGMMGQQGANSTVSTLAQIEAGDQIQFKGTDDTTSSTLTINKIFVWL